jgi:Uma2 family endonuclease
MSIDVHALRLQETIEYPDSDGEPLADNNEQLRLIFLIKNELDDIFADDKGIAVEGDLLWYPVEGHPEIRRAPDTMVIFGRPKQYRGSYKQWVEDGVAPQVAFEIISPGNTGEEMREKRRFYERYGVEEYYEYDPDRLEVRGWLRMNGTFQPLDQMNGWVSPRLGIRFEQSELGELRLYRPDGRPFRHFVEVARFAQQAELRAEQEQLRAEREFQRAELERLRAEEERERAELERLRAEEEHRQVLLERERFEQASKQAEIERERAEREFQRAELERLEKETLQNELEKLRAQLSALKKDEE